MNKNKFTKISLTKAEKLKNKFFAVLVLFLCSATAFAQVKTIKGVVTDALNETLIGASVIVVNTSKTAATDLDGNYTIEAKEGDNLQFSYIGMKTQTVKVGNSNVINVTFEDNAQMLGEVTVEVGYGKIKKRDLTGSIVSVK